MSKGPGVALVGVALVHDLCTVCCKKTDERILMNQILTDRRKIEVEELNGKAIGMSLCKDCLDHINNGVSFLIEVEDDSSVVANNRIKPEEANRTGRIFGLKKEAVKRIFNSDEHIIFTDNETLEKIGL